MRSGRWLLVFLLLALPVRGQEAPESPADAADRAIAAHRDRDAAVLRDLADQDDPDPWLVVEELSARGEFATATALAAKGSRPDTKVLPAYVRSRRKRPPEPATMSALAQAERAAEAGPPARALDLLEPLRQDADALTAIRVAFARGKALASDGRHAEAIPEFEAAAAAAEKIGWLARAMHSLTEAGFAACRSDDLAGAAARWEKSRELNERREDAPSLVSTLRNLAFVYGKLGDADRSVAHRLAEAAIHEKAGDLSAAAVALGQACDTRRAEGQLRKALEHISRAVNLLRKTGSEKEVADYLLDVGTLRRQIGDPERVLRLREGRLPEPPARRAGGEVVPPPARGNRRGLRGLVPEAVRRLSYPSVRKPSIAARSGAAAGSGSSGGACSMRVRTKSFGPSHTRRRRTAARATPS